MRESKEILSKIKVTLLAIEPWLTDEDNYKLLVESVHGRFEKIFLTRGRMGAIAELKSSRLAFTRWLAGHPMKGSVGAPITRNGLPKCIPLSIRIGLSRDNTPLIKCILTVLSISRYYLGGTKVDLEPITSPGPGSSSITDQEIQDGVTALGYEGQYDRPTQEDIFKWMSTAGPNGPSLAASLTDLPLFYAKFKSQVAVMLPDLLPCMDKVLSYNSTINLPKLLGLDKYKAEKLRKISIKPDREGKSRVFAIFDYWSQATLTPLHDTLYDVLRHIPQDCTYDQTAGIKKILEKKSRKYFYSYDLKSATDRFPVELQERVLSWLIDKEYAKAWREIMTSEPFHTKESETPINWGAGQPLGAKSSWAMFTLSHHVVVQIAAARANARPDYVLLGDDIVLRGRALADKYRSIMRDLGVEISEAKSHVSKDTFEFAKVWTHKGVNVSGFPVVGLLDLVEKPIELASLLVFEAPKKGYPIADCPRSLSDQMTLLTQLYPANRQAVWKANRVCWYIAFVNWLHTGSSDWAKYITQMAGPSMSPFESNVLLTKLVREKWSEQIHKGLSALHSYAVRLGQRIPDKLLYEDEDSEFAFVYIASPNPSALQLASHLLNIPLFAALQRESHIEYGSFLGYDSTDEEPTFSLEELEKLKLPPSPQLKGFEPVRAKTYVRALDLLTREINSLIRATASTT